MKKKLKRLNPEVYRKAAKNLNQYLNFSCISVKYTALDIGEDYYEHQEAYRNLFSPPAGIASYDPEYIQVGAWGWLWGKADQERNNCRVLALLFMAEIAKGE